MTVGVVVVVVVVVVGGGWRDRRIAAIRNPAARVGVAQRLLDLVSTAPPARQVDPRYDARRPLAEDLLSAQANLQDSDDAAAVVNDR